MEQIKVSVLIYVLNDHIHIEKCVRSVMEQSLKETEILLIDGGSTDGTLDIVGKLQKEDARIRLVESKAGVGRQFNAGLKAARGKYIGICESDDYLRPDMYERQYAVAEQFQVDVLKADVVRFCESNDKEYAFRFTLSGDWTLYEKLLYPQTDERFLKLGVNGFWSGLYLRKFLLDHELWMNETAGAAYQDITFSFLTELYAERAYVMREAFYCYRMDNPNSSVNNPQRISMLREEYQMLKEQLKKRNRWEICKEIYWKWRTSGYFWFYDNLSEKMRTEYPYLLYQELREEMENERYLGAQLSQKERELCDAAQGAFEKFQCFMEADDEAWEQMQQKIRELKPEQEKVIFGMGNIGFLVNCYLEQCGMPAVAGMDNDSEKWDQQINGLSVLSPEAGVKRYPNAIFIVANVNYANEMKKQLWELGVKEQNIIICSRYDLFLKKNLVRMIREE